MATGATFFNDTRTIDALAGLAEADSLTVVAGAGVSVEAGLPTWGELVHRLLVATGRRLLGARATQQPQLAAAFGALARWEALGLTVLQPDHFSDSAQFLYELLHRRAGDGVGGYADRLRRWEADVTRDLLRTDTPATFADQQDWLQSELEAYRSQVQDRLADAALLQDERLQVSLWVRQPGDSLLLLAASDRAHRDPETLEPVAISGPSEWVSVQAFRRGSTLLAATSAQSTSRWNTVWVSPCPSTIRDMDACRSASSPWPGQRCSPTARCPQRAPAPRP